MRSRANTHLSVPFDERLNRLVRFEDFVYWPVPIGEVKVLRIDDDERRVFDGYLGRSLERSGDVTESKVGRSRRGHCCVADRSSWFLQLI